MKIVTVIGARPQFIKAAALSRIIQQDYIGEIEEILVHTGQHHDNNMSQVFFTELNIPTPKYNLGIAGGQHGNMTGRMLEAIESVLLVEMPTILLVYGDTNSTLAAVLAAAKLNIPIAHVEAGLRSYNMQMPEEINRLLTDRLSKYLFCPTKTAVKNLYTEGISDGVYQTGDVMYDAALYFFERAKQQSIILDEHHLKRGEYVLVTCHRAENTDNAERLTAIMQALAKIANDLPVLFPLHPRTRECIQRYGLEKYLQKINVVNPLSFFDMAIAEEAAKVILTDSGGVQKEAFFYRVPCVTMRDETEWVETVELGWNQLARAESDSIHSSVIHASQGHTNDLPFGNGQASTCILNSLARMK